MAAGATINYEDFEPYCKWQREQGRDTLEVHVQGFKKNQMKIQLSDAGVMLISGERPLDETNSNRSRFRKEIRLSKDYKNNEIHAKISGGVLYIIMPKKSPTTSSNNFQFQEQPTLPPQNQGNENAKLLSKELSSYGGFRLRDLVTDRKKGENVAVAAAIAIILGAFALYKYWQPSHVDN